MIFIVFLSLVYLVYELSAIPFLKRKKKKKTTCLEACFPTPSKCVSKPGRRESFSDLTFLMVLQLQG